MPRANTVDDFFRQIEKGDGCWIWKGALHDRKGGYGKFKIGGRTVKAHRYSYEIHFNVSLTPEQHVLHKCDNRLCVNPDHFFLGDNAINTADMVNKQRHLYGVKHPRCSLTESTVKAILHDYWINHMKRKDIVMKYKLGFRKVKAIINRETWKHIPIPTPEAA